jgi:2-polyprenyl-6-methoxyphenol hydroxylase-like FAD-dependent oxidoreductase
VGDAGYFKDPITAHGITDSLRDAELLSKAIVDSEQRTDALSHYQSQRDALSLELFSLTDRIASLQWDLEELGQLHRRLSKVMQEEVVFLEDRHRGVRAAA